jgi:hypothetical protein
MIHLVGILLKKERIIMKYSLVILLTCIIYFVGWPVETSIAQEKKVKVQEKPKKIEDDKVRDKQAWQKEKAKRTTSGAGTVEAPPAPDQDNSGRQTKVKTKTGYGYDRDKQDLSGKDDGKKRSFETRSHRQQDIEEIERELAESEKSLHESRMKIREARIKLAQDQKAGKIKSEKEIRAKQEQIAESEKRLDILEKRIREKRNRLSKLKDELQNPK